MGCTISQIYFDKELIYSYNKSQRDALFLKFILTRNSYIPITKANGMHYFSNFFLIKNSYIPITKAKGMHYFSNLF